MGHFLLGCLLVGAALAPPLFSQAAVNASSGSSQPESETPGDPARLAPEEAPVTDTPGTEDAAPASGSASGYGGAGYGATAIERQTSSIRRQLGRAARGNDGFYVSSWFSANPVNPQAAIARSFSPPGDCDPLDQTIAEAYMRDSATREGVALDLVREVVRKESGFYPCAVSPKGAMGMMQLMPETAATLGVADPFDPRENIDGGVRLLRRLLEKYKGRPDLALAAYNAGEGAVDRASGVPAFAETREYVGTIMQRVFEAPPVRKPATGNSRNAPARIAPPSPPSAKGIPPIPGASPGNPSPNATLRSPVPSEQGQAAVQ